MGTEGRLYFECGGLRLDNTVQKERWFGAVWTYTDGMRYPLEYWFEDTEDRLYEQWVSSKWYECCTVLFTPHPINQVYKVVREQQKQAAKNTVSHHLDNSIDE
ncbi:hypothetical protein JZ785_16080 [Alicyclobacillus curvatus]|jgi:hypothetical protein|nr:hypothetical protein JZ785_16080 [Alicyclobacillus curvatus]